MKKHIFLKNKNKKYFEMKLVFELIYSINFFNFYIPKFFLLSSFFFICRTMDALREFWRGHPQLKYCSRWGKGWGEMFSWWYPDHVIPTFRNQHHPTKKYTMEQCSKNKRNVFLYCLNNFFSNSIWKYS